MISPRLPRAGHRQERKVNAVPAVVLGSGIIALGVIRLLRRVGVETFAANSADPLLAASRFFRPLPSECPIPAEGSLAAWLDQLPLERAVLVPCSDHWVAETAALPAGV